MATQLENQIEINQENMTRAAFLKNLGLGSSALMAFYCMGTLSSCSKAGDPTPVTGGGTTGGTTVNPATGKIDFTLNIATTLAKVGDFTYNGNIIVIRTDTKIFVALAKACTHQGTTVEYRADKKDIWCSNHGSVFNTNGTVALGPAGTALKSYNVELKTNDTEVRVFE